MIGDSGDECVIPGFARAGERVRWFAYERLTDGSRGWVARVGTVVLVGRRHATVRNSRGTYRVRVEELYSL